ncbi:TPM domain-containing protein [Spirulina subsalsa FACHB-351]|uniref:TPM domain-containing protein n=1 Tax=Spirulina subsalsa FACHB-351 TaxID=234711 RepID=A0ABT3L5D7_9CYAN|nr:TPM domain-containing protein [Spirulina subsalsa]MCW6036716.1 TPM domain-containing protein [Spirulina subsalsa FACHB-351]
MIYHQHPLKTLFALIIVTLGLILQPGWSYALTPDQVPNPYQLSDGWVTDMADVLDSTTEHQLNQIISDLEAKNGAEIVIVTVPQINQDLTPKQFTTELFNLWGIGKAGQDNGILFLTSVGDRAVEIETGYGIEGILPDGRVGRILDNHVVPYFQNDDFSNGILAGTQALIQVVQNETFDPNLSPAANVPNLLWIFTGITAFFAYPFYQLARNKTQEPLLVKPGDYEKIKGFDPSEKLIYVGLRVSAFFILFTLTAIPLILTLYASPNLALLSGVTIILLLFLFLLYKSNTLTAILQTLKTSDSSTQSVFVILSAICGGVIIFFLLYLDFHLIGDILALSLLGMILPRYQRLSTSIPTIFLAIFGSLTFFFFWTLYYNEVWGYVPTLLGALSDSLGRITAGVIVSIFISGLGCFPIAHYLLKWQFKAEEKRHNLRPICNAQSQVPMESLNEETVQSILSEHQKVAQNLGNIRFEGWWTPENRPVAREDVYLRGYVQLKGWLGYGGYLECPVGQELTVSKKSKQLKRPTQTSTGLRRITESCQCCDYIKEYEEAIPRLSSSSSSSGRRSSGSKGRSSSSGGSRGGGRSGGGGAGRRF